MGPVVPIDPTGSVQTDVRKVSADGKVVGYFKDAGGTTHGFTLIGGTYTTIDVPGATATFAEAINDDGVVVGNFKDSLGNFHGFIDNAGTITTIDSTGAVATDLEGINDSGVVAGFYSGTADFGSPTTGFIYSAGTYTTFGPTGGNTSVGDINASGQVAGWVFNPGTSQSQGFVYSDGTLNTFDGPATYSVIAADINASGQVVGDLEPTSGAIEGFIEANGTVTPVPGPDGDSLFISGENASGNFVGYYVDSGGNWVPYVDTGGVMTTLDMPAGSSFGDARAITDEGHIYGTYIDSGGHTEGFEVACFANGTRIATPGGLVPIERLRIGDAVCTHSGAALPVKWIGRRTYDAATVAANAQLRPVRIHAHALADGVPCRDLLISPCHAVLVDGDLIPAGALVNGLSITREPPCAITYLHIETDRHTLIEADGAAAETFVDQANRSMFENAAEYFCLYPNSAPPSASMKIIDSGPAVEAARRRLGARAGIPVLRPARPGRLQGHVEFVGHDMIEGWVIDRDDPDQAVELELVLEDEPPVRVFANRYRADLDRAGLAGGRCSFRHRPSAPTRDVLVRRASDGLPLAFSPNALAPVAISPP